MYTTSGNIAFRLKTDTDLFLCLDLKSGLYVPLNIKAGYFRDVFPSQSLSMLLKK